MPAVSPTVLDTRLWRLPEAERALAEAADAWAAGGPAAALSALRRTNRVLQEAGQVHWRQHGERLLAAVAQAAHTDPPVALGPLRNALREFERQVWRLGAPPARKADEGGVGGAGEAREVADTSIDALKNIAADGSTDGDAAELDGWPIAAARHPTWAGDAARAGPLRQRFERDLLPALRATGGEAGAAFSRMAATAGQLCAPDERPRDMWRLAAAWLATVRMPTLRDKRLCAQLNLVLARQLKAANEDTERAAPDDERVLSHALMAALVRSDGALDSALDGAHDGMLVDFGWLQHRVSQPGFVWPGATEGDAIDGRHADAMAWQSVGPLSVRQGVSERFLDLADDSLPALPDPQAAWVLARGAWQIGLTSVARLAAVLAALGDDAARSGTPLSADIPPIASAIDALRGMLHQFAAQAFPEARADLVAALARLRAAA